MLESRSIHKEWLSGGCDLWAASVISPYFYKNKAGKAETMEGVNYLEIITDLCGHIRIMWISILPTKQWLFGAKKNSVNVYHKSMLGFLSLGIVVWNKRSFRRQLFIKLSFFPWKTKCGQVFVKTSLNCSRLLWKPLRNYLGI